jgi:hypothetical protein
LRRRIELKVGIVYSQLNYSSKGIQISFDV